MVAGMLVIMMMMIYLSTTLPYYIYGYKKIQTVMDQPEFQKCRIGYSEGRRRIRTNTTTDMTPVGQDFTSAGWNPDPLYMDIDNFTFSGVEREGVDDVIIDIGPEVGGWRAMSLTALKA